ncbi:MAG: hypothetical protein JWQ29_551 [Phenylobacterium sp.]|nr:hypothetical protein [Phenylobacterium sp.]
MRSRAGPSAVLAFVSVALLACSAPAATLKANPSNIKVVLAFAKAGDVVVLADGEYAPVAIAKKTYKPPLVIDASGATLVGWRVGGVDGLTFRGGVFKVPPAAFSERKQVTFYGPAIRFDAVGHIRFQDATFQGPGDLTKDPPVFGEGIGLSVNVGEDIKVIDSHFKGLKAGIGFGSVDGFQVVGNTFAGMRSDGFQAGMSRHGLIEGNECAGTRISGNGEHPDCIQLWSRPPAAPTADITIRKNKISGITQGIGLFNHVRDGVDDGGFDRITIEDNDIEVGFPNAIGMNGSRDSVVRNNRVRTMADSRYIARISIDEGAVRCGNVVAAGAGKSGMTDKRC